VLQLGGKEFVPIVKECDVRKDAIVIVIGNHDYLIIKE